MCRPDLVGSSTLFSIDFPPFEDDLLENNMWQGSHEHGRLFWETFPLRVSKATRRRAKFWFV